MFLFADYWIFYDISDDDKVIIKGSNQAIISYQKDKYLALL